MKESLVQLREIGGLGDDFVDNYNILFSKGKLQLGNQPSTVAGRNSAKAVFVEFIKMKGLESFEIIIENEAIICEKSLMKQFASFLIDYAVSSKSALPFKGGVALQYLSGVINIIRQRWPENVNYRNKAPEWIADIRKSIDKEIRRKCIDTGREYAEKSPPIGRNSMGIIAESLLRSNNAAALMSRSAIITNFCSVGNFIHHFIIFIFLHVCI